jgi:hypothetical protein
MISQPDFQAALLRGLRDTGTAGTLTVAGGRLVSSINLDGELLRTYQDPLAPIAGTALPFRVCDLYADKLSLNEAFPNCQLYWPLDMRNAAVAQCIDLLQRYGAGFTNVRRLGPMLGPVRIALPPLDHPATAEDVQKGLAIFSLGAKARMVPMPPLPVRASWITLMDNPVSTGFANPDGTQIIKPVYHNEGRVFQAEEIEVGGRWERFYGFVGRYHLAKVPGAEIEFPARGWIACNDSLDCQVRAPGATADQEIYSFLFTKASSQQPIIFTLNIRNRKGSDQTVDGKWVQTAMTFSLRYSPTPPQQQRGQEMVNQAATWEEVPIIWRGAGLKPDAQKILHPAQEFVAAKIDLRDLGKIDRPGIYQLVMHLPNGKSASANCGVDLP